jgi:steroid delta-isomerase
MPTPEQIRDVVERYVKSWEAGDKEGWVGCFADDAEQIDPYPQPANVGREAIARFFDTARSLVEEYRFTTHYSAVAGDRCAMTFTLALKTGDTTVEFDGVDLFEVNDDGLISRLTAYWDPSTMRLL